MHFIRHVRIDIRPLTYVTEGDGVLHRMRVTVDSNSDSYSTDMIMTEDDFTSRFDWIFEHSIRVLKHEFAKTEKQRKEQDNAEAQEAHGPAVHAQGGKTNGEVSG